MPTLVYKYKKKTHVNKTETIRRVI